MLEVTDLRNMPAGTIGGRISLHPMQRHTIDEIIQKV